MTTMIATNSTFETLASRDYEKALRKATWRGFLIALKRGCNDLMPMGTILEQLELHNSRQLGVKQVSLNKIIGSTGRYRDFDLTFLPRRKETDGRWLRVARARREGVKLPPPKLYKVGEAYFVEDGNHRISVARAAAEEHIHASVTELDASTLNSETEISNLLRQADGQISWGLPELTHKLLASAGRFLVFLGEKLRVYEFLTVKQLSRSTTAS